LERFEPPILRAVVWLGDSKSQVQAFPKRAQKLIGDELQLMRFGGMPKDAKPLMGIGSGIFEIALRYLKESYRVAVALQRGERIYVLHAFQKKSKRGLATPKSDVALIRRRYVEAQMLAQ
jgi:phage-related protein